MDTPTARLDIAALDRALAAMAAFRESVAAISTDGLSSTAARHIELCVTNATFEESILNRAKSIRAEQIKAGI